MSTHDHIQYEATASVGSDKLDLSDPALKEAYEDVKKDSTKTNWALFGYVPNSNKLYVAGSGEGGIEEFTEELNSGTPGYAFVRLETDSSYGGSTQHTKFLYITWAPDGVPATRKGILHTHSELVAKFLKGYHAQINARTEEDLDLEAILQSFLGECNNLTIGILFLRNSPSDKLEEIRRHPKRPRPHMRLVMGLQTPHPNL